MARHDPASIRPDRTHAAPDAPRTAVKRAADAVEGGGTTPWDEPSRLGGAGRLMRRGLRRGLRPFERRQREIDSALLDALGSVAGEPGALRNATPLPAGLTDATTRIGSLWLRPDDELLAPTILEHGIYDPLTSALLSRRLQPGFTFVDVGANVGWFSVFASRLVGPHGRVFAVEPDPANIAVLRANLWRNSCANVTVLPLAAWSEPTHLSLFSHPGGGAGTEVRREREHPTAGDDGEVAVAVEHAGGDLVPAGRLDALIEGRVDMIKIDAQMTDHLVLRGATGLIADNPSITVTVEHFPAALSERGEDPERILDDYEELGLELGLLRDDATVAPAGREEIRAACERPEIPFVDIVLSRRAGHGPRPHE